MTTLRELAYAKINITLDILGKRPDGYHDLKSIMQTVSLHDVVELDIGTGKPWTLSCGKPDIPCDERNLAWKAAKLYCDAVGKDPDGIAIRIEKNIPSGAGMAGGSADAAAVLRALNRYYGELLTPEATMPFTYPFSGLDWFGIMLYLLSSKMPTLAAMLLR